MFELVKCAYKVINPIHLVSVVPLKCRNTEISADQMTDLLIHKISFGKTKSKTSKLSEKLSTSVICSAEISVMTETRLAGLLNLKKRKN